jgi:hypothetical protein
MLVEHFITSVHGALHRPKTTHKTMRNWLAEHGYAAALSAVLEVDAEMPAMHLLKH